MGLSIEFLEGALEVLEKLHGARVVEELAALAAAWKVELESDKKSEIVAALVEAEPRALPKLLAKGSR